MKKTKIAALTVCVALAGGVGAAGASGTGSAPGAVQITSGDHYDRNATVVQDGKTTWMFFARSQDTCNRLDGCDVDNSNYDLWAQTSTNKGKTWSEPAMIAANPGNEFRGRTIAATRTDDKKIWLFWTSGGNSKALYYLSRDPQTKTWSSPTAVDDELYFNAEAVAKKNTVFLYYEDGGRAEGTAGVWERTFNGSTFSDPVSIAPGRSLPKVMMDKKGVFRMAMVDSRAWPYVDVDVATSANGTTWSTPAVAIQGDGTITNWDPTLTQDGDRFAIVWAPDTGDGSQHIGTSVSTDFQHWSSEYQITDPPAGTWDYWPEVTNVDGLRLYYTSEAGEVPGTGHIWTLSE